MKVLADHDPADWRDCSLCRHYIEAQDADPSYDVVDDLETRAKQEQFWNHTPHGRVGQLYSALLYVQYQRGLGLDRYPASPSGQQRLAQDLRALPRGYPERFIVHGLRPWVPAMLLCLERGQPMLDDLVQFVFGDPPPPLEAVRRRLATLDAAQQLHRHRVARLPGQSGCRICPGWPRGDAG
jgi:hypothetical protein